MGFKSGSPPNCSRDDAFSRCLASVRILGPTTAKFFVQYSIFDIQLAHER